jgi:hypothetical protein
MPGLERGLLISVRARDEAREEQTPCSPVAILGCARGGIGPGRGKRAAEDSDSARHVGGPNSAMCIACKADTPCEHALNESGAIDGEYCIVCHHRSSLPNLARRKPAPLGPRKARPSMSALLREIRQRRGRRRA